MNPQQRATLRNKSWLNRARSARMPVARAIAKALGKPESEIEFADLDVSKRVSEMFASRTCQVDTVEVRDRAAAIAMVETELKDVSGPAYYLPPAFNECGVVLIDFGIAIEHLDALLAHQDELFRLVSPDGEQGACISTQEGSFEGFARFVNVWSVNRLPR